MTRDICYTSAAELAMRIRRGELSPVDVVEAHLSRIDEVDDEINAYITVCADRARDEAREAERAVSAGKTLGPLHGVPIAIKDLYDVGGVRTTHGSRLFADNMAESDDPTVARLRDAGAIVIGKTNTPQFGRAGTSDSPVNGATGSPFAPETTAGGSSGGSAAAAAAGMAPLTHGSDAGGSIRIPASFCGVFGIKPSFGRLPMVKSPDAFTHHTPMCNVGPMTRTVEDAALMLEAWAGPHPRDPFSLPDDGTDYLGSVRQSVDELSIAYSPTLDVFPVAKSVQNVIDDAVDTLDSSTGAHVERIEVDLGRSHDEILSAMYDTWSPVGHALHNEILADEHGIDIYKDHRAELTDYSVETTQKGRTIRALEYRKANIIRSGVYHGIQDVFDEYDILLSPTVSVPPFDKRLEAPETVNGEPVHRNGWHLTLPFNFTGHPAASVPAGFTDDELPVGLQIAGRRFADDDVLAVSAAFERLNPWHTSYSSIP